MMKRSASGAKEENYEHVLMCLICRSLFDDHDHQPKFLPCHHTFCKDCLREYVRQMGDEIECPSCRKIANVPAAGVAALQTNFYVKYIQSLVQCGGGVEGSTKECTSHATEKLHEYCKECDVSICRLCITSGCGAHSRVPLTTITEQSHQELDTAFSEANSTIEGKKVRIEHLLKAFADEKDQALMKIDSSFEQLTHTLNRRATLLKNKVIDIYNEHVEKLESDLEEISTAMTCIVSLKDYHENKISHGQFADVSKGIEEMREVNENIDHHINPRQNHIIFEDKHGLDKFRVCAKDVGRVRSSRPTIPRSEPEGEGAPKPKTSPLNSPNTPDHATISSPDQPSSPVKAASQPSSPVKPATAGGEPGAVAAVVKTGPRIFSPTGDGNGNLQSALKAIPVVSQAADSGPSSPKTVRGTRASPAREVAPSVSKPCDKVDKENNPVNPVYSGPSKEKLSLELDTSLTKAKVDKAYYHLLYTSYDEEELLRELKSGRSGTDLVQQAIKNSSEQKGDV